MIFFTVFFTVLPMLAVCTIPAILVPYFIEHHDQEGFSMKQAIIETLLPAIWIATGLTFIISSIFWIGKYWGPLMSATFGSL